jgi:hypothetical protein
MEEVTDLGNASHPTLEPANPESLKLARAVSRGQIVLLSSHFERYIHSLNEELGHVDKLLNQSLAAAI